MHKKLVIAGIGTEVGKTIVSAIVTEALAADYWKPVQAGELEHADTDKVRELISNSVSHFHPETYRLKAAMSPHAAAALENLQLSLNDIHLPETQNTLVIELAGGIMVPLNNDTLNLDLLKHWNIPVLLVSRNYLGSINHTLLSVEVLKHNRIPIAGIIFNGESNTATEELILNYTGIELIGQIGNLNTINKKTIQDLAQQFKPSLIRLLQ